MEKLEVGDSEQVHAAFLVYMDLAEGEFDNLLLLFVCLFVCVSCRDRLTVFIYFHIYLLSHSADDRCGLKVAAKLSPHLINDYVQEKRNPVI